MASTIVTLTLNPAIDQAISLDEIVLGDLNRCAVDAIDPGGKGVNASRMIARLGRPTLALGFTGGVTGAMLRTRLDAERVPYAFDDVAGLTRINVMVYERRPKRRTRLYLPGAAVDGSAFELLQARLRQLPAGSIVVMGGSVPPGLDGRVYRDLVAVLEHRGVRTFVDASGEALREVLPARPELVKPNLEEAAELVGRELSTDEDVLDAAEEIRDRGSRRVVISRGADGAIGLDGSGAWTVTGPDVVAVSTVGSGDSMMAGLAIAFAEGGTLADGLRLGAAAGAATAMVRGTQLGSREQVERLVREVVVRPLAPATAAAAR